MPKIFLKNKDNLFNFLELCRFYKERVFFGSDIKFQLKKELFKDLKKIDKKGIVKQRSFYYLLRLAEKKQLIKIVKNKNFKFNKIKYLFLEEEKIKTLREIYLKGTL